jgi:hypothetical protein
MTLTEYIESYQINNNEQKNCQTTGKQGATNLQIPWHVVVKYYDSDCDNDDDDDDDEVTEHPHHPPPK